MHTSGEGGKANLRVAWKENAILISDEVSNFGGNGSVWLHEREIATINEAIVVCRCHAWFWGIIMEFWSPPPRAAACVFCRNRKWGGGRRTHSFFVRAEYVLAVKLFSADETALILSAWERRNYQSWETLFLLSSALHYPNKRVSSWDNGFTNRPNILQSGLDK